MKKKNQRQIRKNQLRFDIKQALKYHKKLERIASGGGIGTGFPIGSDIPCPSCYEFFKKEWPRQKYCSSRCRKDKVKLDRMKARKSKSARLELRRMRKVGGVGGNKAGSKWWTILDCKRCEHSFVKEHSRQEYCPVCGLIMSTSKGRREHEDAIIDRLVEDRMIQEDWGEL